MTITPLVLGSGRASQAITKALACLNIMEPTLGLAPAVQLSRGANLAEEKGKYPNPILCIASPPGLHAEAILAADRVGFKAILCEKPACVNLDELVRLRNVRTPTAVLHVYRMMWGPQTLKRLISESFFGEVISIEGRYWQSSTADRALAKAHGQTPAKGWKDDPRLSGDSDVYLDIGTHWIDSASFLQGATPTRIAGWRSFANADSPHRDSHVQIALHYAKGKRALGSISKTLHGATNHFELNVIGTKASATWEFLNPDEILIGEGRERRVLIRQDTALGSMQPAFHAMGWLEGYIEIARRLLSETFNSTPGDYPTLNSNLDVLEAMFKTEWSEG